MNRWWIVAFLVVLAGPVIGGLWFMTNGVGFDLVQPVVTIVQIVAVLVLLALRWQWR